MTICIFGDSITWGATDCEKGGWVERLKTELMLKDIDVYNLGISGDTAEELIKRFEAEAEVRNPDIVIFAIGINDSLNIGEDRDMGVARFKNNIATLFYKARVFTDKIVFVGLTDVDEAKTNPSFTAEDGEAYSNKDIGEYDEAIRTFCEENELIFVDMMGLLSDKEDLCDGLHPSSAGHKKMFAVISKAIEPIWKE